LTQSFRSHYDSGVDPASNRNEYQEYFLGGKGGRCVRLTILFMCRFSWNLGASTSWNPQTLSGPVMGLFSLYEHCHCVQWKNLALVCTVFLLRVKTTKRYKILLRIEKISKLSHILHILKSFNQHYSF